MTELKLNFETEELRENFIGWFCDGGGEDEFYESRSYDDVPNFISKLKFTNGRVKEIDFTLCEEE